MKRGLGERPLWLQAQQEKLAFPDLGDKSRLCNYHNGSWSTNDRGVFQVTGKNDPPAGSEPAGGFVPMAEAVRRYPFRSGR